jgi:hypothetical protein
LSNFDDKRSPHLYFKEAGVKVILPYDPAWVVTSTAYSDFRSGTTKLSGIGLVKSVSNDNSQIIVTPFILGFPRTPFMEEWDAALAERNH